MNKPAIILGLILVVFAASVWTFWPKDKPTVGESVPLPPIKEVRTIERIIERPKLVYVYPDKVKKKIDLPKPVAEDKNKKVIATGKLKAEERDYTLSGVLDTQTGYAEIYARPDPLPWLSYGKRGAVGVAYGNGTGKVYGYHDLLQIKALHAGARAEIDQRGEWWAGGYAEWRW